MSFFSTLSAFLSSFRRLVDDRHQLVFYCSSIVFALLCCPVFFLAANEDLSNENKESLQAISSHQFAYSVVSFIGYGLPLALDVLVDYLFEEREKREETPYSPRRVRGLVAFCILLTSLLNVHYSIIYPNVRATWAIISIRLVFCSCIGLHQMSFRFKHVLSPASWYGMYLCWSVAAILSAYSVRLDSNDSLVIISRILRSFTIASLLLSQIVHVRLSLLDKLGGSFSDDKWRAIGISIVAIIAIFLFASFSIAFQSSLDIYTNSLAYWLGFNYYTASSSIAIAVVVSQELRLNYAVVQTKLFIKRQFVRYMSHEVRTPLNSCVLGLKYLQSQVQDFEKDINLNSTIKLQTVITEIEDCCSTVVDFMNNLLLYEKIETTNIPLTLRAESLVKICQTVVHSFVLTARQIGVSIDFEMRCFGTRKDERDRVACDAFALVDASKIIIVLRVLLSTSLQHTPEGGHVSVSLTPVDLSGVARKSVMVQAPVPVTGATHFRVEVSDTGPGLTPPEQRQFFDDVAEFSPRENQQGAGSGIGLYLSQKIAQLHGAAIQVSSDGVKGKGSQFWMDFARVEDSSASLRSSVVSIVDSEVLTMGNSKKTQSDNSIEFSRIPSLSAVPSPHLSHAVEELSIMIIDDSRMTRKMVTRSLKQRCIGGTLDEAVDGVDMLNLLGIPTTVTESAGDEGDCVEVEIISKEAIKRYDMLLLDNSMPRMSGKTAVSKLRELGYDGLVVGLTGDATPDQVDAFREGGANFVLIKPLDIEKLLEIIEGCMSKV